MAGLTRLPQGKTAYSWDLPAQAGPAAPSAQPSSLGDQIGAQITTLDRMLTTPNAMPPGHMPPVASNPWREIQSFVGKTMAVVMSPIDMLNQAAASLTFPLAMMLPAFPAVRLYQDLTFTLHIHPHPPTFGIPIPAVGPCVAAGACTVLINGLPAARSGDFGLSAWCGGYFPIFEVVTGSSHCMIQGARPARMTDITLHCTKTGGLGALGVGMMMFNAAMGAVGLMAATTDEANALAADAAAEAAAAAVEASAAALQLAADCAAMAMSIMMGMDPAVPPAIGMFITGSPDVVIGGFPMPGWTMILKGLLKILRLIARAIQLLLPEGSRLRNALCALTGHPVDIATGRVFTSQVDFELPWRVPVRFERYYDSSSTAYEGPLGPGWTHTYDIHLWRDAGQHMAILRDEEGHLEGYPEIGVGKRAVHPLYRSTLYRVAPNEYRLLRPDGMKYIFSTLGDAAMGDAEATPLRLTRVENRNNSSADLLYEDGRLTGLDDATGRYIAFRYVTVSGRQRLSEIRLDIEGAGANGNTLLASFAYDDNGRLIGAFDANLNPYRYAYADNLLVRETNRNGLSFQFAYDGTGEDARCIHTWGGGGIYERRFTYDSEAQRTAVTDSLGATRVYWWNDAGLVTQTVDPINATTTLEYDECHRKVLESQPDGSTWKWQYGQTGAITAITNPLGETTRIIYDAADRPVKTEWPDGSVSKRGYDAHGNVVWTENGLNARRNYTYEFGNLIQLESATGSVDQFDYNSRGELVRWTNAEGMVTSLTYTARGRTAQVVAPGNRRTEYTYDVKDRLIQVRFPDGTRNRYRYDAEDNLIGFTNASDYLTQYMYEGFNKISERVEPSGHRLRYLYDTEENLIGLVNQRGDKFRFQYDIVGRRVEDETFDGVIRRYGYDKNGWTNRIEEVSSNGAGRLLTFLDRDPLGQILAKHQPSGAVHRFEYDRMGRVIGAQTPAHSVTIRYDTAGNVIEERQGEEYVRIEYDEEGRRKRRISSLGHTVEYQFSPANLLTRLTISGEQTGTAEARFRYNSLGMLAEQTVSGGVHETFEYDPAGRLARQEIIARGRSTSRYYHYSSAGTIASITDSDWGRHDFAHDPAGRLIAALAPSGVSERFDFDPAGNLILAGDKRYQVGKGNRLVEKNGLAYRYNGFGDLEERPAPSAYGSRQLLTYADQHRLDSVKAADGSVLAAFEYDAFGRRVKKAAGPVEFRYVWDGPVLLADVCGSNAQEYVFGWFEPILRYAGKSVLFYHNDDIGTPRSLTDENGLTVWGGRFHPWGKKEWESGSTDQLIGRPGQYVDTETGLAYNFFRYYDPEDARYITHDPMGLAGNENFYLYPLDPVSWTDPLGLILVYHYTNKKGYNSIRSTPIWHFRASTPPGDHPRGVYVTPLPPGDERLYKLGIPRDKREFFFAMDVPEELLKRLRGGRGEYSWYTEDDLFVEKPAQRGHGKC